jgi:hypothetical protein
MKFSKKQIDDLMNGVFDGTIDYNNLPKDLYLAIAGYLKKGLYEGYGGTLADFDGHDLKMLKSLRENVYLFSGAKTFQQVEAYKALLTDTGGLISFKEFRNAAQETYDLFNVDWALTEYNTAIAQAQNAAKWNDIEANKDVLPMLRYSAIGDACAICQPLDGIVAPVDDDIWDTIMPENHYNCRCIVIQEDADVQPTEGNQDIVDDVSEKMQDVFKSNVGKTGDIYDKAHPYFDIPKEYHNLAKENFNLPIPKNDE